MDDLRLFRNADDRWTTFGELTDTLRELGAADCDVLFVQSGVMFGAPNPELRRKEYTALLFEALRELRVGTIIVPTFTFSFCNGEAYDVSRSKSCMGALSEYIRTQDGAVRTLDPLLSMVTLGKESDLLGQALAPNSLGEGSGYDRIHRAGDRVKFLCYGSDFCEYFTYIHYVEKMLDVPYRFDMRFDGTIIAADGTQSARTQYIHTACAGVEPAAFPQLRQYLIDRGEMRAARAGEADLVCVPEPAVYGAIERKLSENINYFLARPFTAADLTHEYKYGKDGNRVTHC